MKRVPYHAVAHTAASRLALVPDTELVSDGLASLAESKTFLGCGLTKLYELMDSGLPYVINGKSRRIPWRALREFAAANLVRRDRAVAS